MFRAMALIGALAIATGARAASAQAEPLTASLRQMYEPVKGNIVATAETVPAALYSYRPTADVRTIGQLLAHLANAEFTICSGVLGEPNPHPANVEREELSPTDILRLIKESFALCDRAYAGLTDARLTESAPFFGGQQPVHFAMAYNVVHANEHYGNLVTYLRINGIVPPSSRPASP